MELMPGQLCPASKKLSDMTVTTKWVFTMASTMQGKFCLSVQEQLHRYAQKKIHQVHDMCVFMYMCHISVKIDKNLVPVYLEPL